MTQKESKERRILRISLVCSILFALVEFSMAVFVKSQSILMDAAFDASELVVIVASLLLAPLLYKPITEKRPFGYAQCESLFIIVKGFMLVSVTISLIVSNIQLMLSGGNNVDMNVVSMFELILSVLALIALLVVKHYSKKLNSPLITAEVVAWKIDVVCGVGVSIAFFIPQFINIHQFAWISPYFDQIVAIILALLMLPEPIKMVIKSLNDILLFAPKDEFVNNIKEVVEPICTEKEAEIVFIDILQTGRKTWITITLKIQNEKWVISQLKYLYKELYDLLNTEIEDFSLELIPSLED